MNERSGRVVANRLEDRDAVELKFFSFVGERATLGFELN